MAETAVCLCRHLPDGHILGTGRCTTPRCRCQEFAARESLLTAAEVAALFRVGPKTPVQWAKQGRLTSVRTLGGHHRFRESEVRALLAGNGAS